MSMTREEAFKKYEEWRNLGFGHSTMPPSEVLVMAMNSLRPITRERLEKVWKPCKVCNGKTTLYQHTNTTKLFMNTFGKAATLVTECNACPPYADCCMKGISMNSAFRISYCPECGRPLTDEAVDMVMERISEMEEMANEH